MFLRLGFIEKCSKIRAWIFEKSFHLSYIYQISRNYHDGKTVMNECVRVIRILLWLVDLNPPCFLSSPRHPMPCDIDPSDVSLNFPWSWWYNYYWAIRDVFYYIEIIINARLELQLLQDWGKYSNKLKPRDKSILWSIDRYFSFNTTRKIIDTFFRYLSCIESVSLLLFIYFFTVHNT